MSLPPRVLWIGGAVVAAALAVLIAWQIGAHQGRSENERLQRDLQQAELRLNLLEARRLLHQAILQLEARNFGLAQERAERSAQFLAASKNGAEDDTKDAILSQLQEFRTSVDPDVGRQIALLVQIARALDERTPAPEAPHGLDAPATAEGQALGAPQAPR